MFKPLGLMIKTYFTLREIHNKVDQGAFKLLHEEPLTALRTLNDELSALKFGLPVPHTYNPLAYAWKSHESFVHRYGLGSRKILFFGMNPGAFGMSMTNKGSAS